MEATKEITTGGQRARMSNSRMVFMGAIVLMAFYIIWGIAKIIS